MQILAIETFLQKIKRFICHADKIMYNSSRKIRHSSSIGRATVS